MLIDDDEPTNFLNKMLIEETGVAHEVRVAQSAREALDYLSGKLPGITGDTPPAPDLIFLDINMPAMDGWEFLDRYRQLPSAQKAAIVMIMLTTSLNPDDHLRAREIPEVSGFEHKPLKAHRLKEILESYFPDKA